MGAKTTELTQKQIDFIAKQHIFFIGTADDNSTVNISPKGGDCIRIICLIHTHPFNFFNSKSI